MIRVSVKDKIAEFKEEHPTATKIVKAVAITGAVAGAVVGVSAAVTYISDNGLRFELSSFETREARFKIDGDARELFNAALGIEAKGLDATETWDRYNVIADSYIGKSN